MRPPSSSTLQDKLTAMSERMREMGLDFRITHAVLQAIGTVFDCMWATYWAVHPEQMRLFPDVLWNAKGPTANRLEEHTQHRALSLSEGTAGHVWRSRRPVWTANLALDMCLPRSLDASGAGLRGGVWFALKTDAAVYGVIELLGENLPPASEEAVVVVEQFGIALGRLLEQAHLHAMAQRT